jgi:hypothetical protein
MTLQERLVSEGRKMLGEPAEGYSHYNVDGCTIDQIILHIIEETIKEGIGEIHAELTVQAMIEGTYDDEYVDWETVERVLKKTPSTLLEG